VAYETFYRVVLNYSGGDVEFGLEGLWCSTSIFLFRLHSRATNQHPWQGNANGS
jgi:hypothetical protein